MAKPPDRPHPALHPQLQGPLPLGQVELREETFAATLVNRPTPNASTLLLINSV